MAYTKKTLDEGTANERKVVQFHYKTTDIFDECSEITAFKARGIKNQEGLSNFNELHISEDERIHLKKHVKKGFIEIFAVLFKMLDNASSSVFYDEEITVGGDTFNAYGGIVVDNENRYREINISVIDSKLSDAIVDYVLARWYWLKNLADDSAMHQQRFNKLLNDINDLSLSLRLTKA